MSCVLAAASSATFVDFSLACGLAVRTPVLQVYEVSSLNQKNALPSSPFGDAEPAASPAAQPSSDSLADLQPLSQRRSLRQEPVLDQNLATGLLGKLTRDGKLEVGPLIISSQSSFLFASQLEPHFWNPTSMLPR